MKNISSNNILVGKGLSNDDVGVARGTTVRQEIRARAGFKTGAISSKKNSGGYRRTTHRCNSTVRSMCV